MVMRTSESAPTRLGASESAPTRLGAADRAPTITSRKRWRASALTGGGTDGNEQLTAMTGVILVGLLAVLGLTILRIHQLISVHLFVGLLLLGPLALKLASTGYRFARYYTRDGAYRVKGPPEPGMRLIAPLVVIFTLVVFVSGIVLLFDGPARRGQWVGIHKAAFAMWLIVTGFHVLGHLRDYPGSLRRVRTQTGVAGTASPGGAGRWITLVGALVAGLVLAIVLIPHFGAWTASGAFPQHGDH
jgi:hypothetical protein